MGCLNTSIQTHTKAETLVLPAVENLNSKFQQKHSFHYIQKVKSYCPAACRAKDDLIESPNLHTEQKKSRYLIFSNGVNTRQHLQCLMMITLLHRQIHVGGVILSFKL